MFQIETERVFASDWATIAFGFDVPVPSCVCPFNFLGTVRGHSGKNKVFENVCRHLGMILAEEAKKLSAPITCTYHTWAYNFDGTLHATPHVDGPDIH